MGNESVTAREMVFEKVKILKKGWGMTKNSAKLSQNGHKMPWHGSLKCHKIYAKCHEMGVGRVQNAIK